MARRNITGQNYSISIENNTHVVKAEMKAKIKKMTYAMGLKWQSLATRVITTKRIVDSGRLRGSLTFITSEKVGKSINKVESNQSKDFLKGRAEPGKLIVGTNVEYADKQEFGPKGPYLKPSILDYKESYKNISEDIMKE